MNQSALLPTRHLAVSGLACRRGEYDVFSNISCNIGPGEALLIKGPNGAGKTTFLMCLAGFLPPADGKFVWNGREPEERPGTDIHFIAHRSAVRPGMTVGETLTFWSDLNGGSEPTIADALSEAGLAHARDLDAAYLSQGQARRLALSRLIATPRPIWILDEPTSALDAQGEAWVVKLIEAHLDKGGVLVAATHLELDLKKKSRIKTLSLGDAR